MLSPRARKALEKDDAKSLAKVLAEHPLAELVQNAAMMDAPSCLALLLGQPEARAAVRMTSPVVESTPLHGAKSAAVVDQLVAAGAQVEARTIEQKTPLHLAAAFGSLAAVERLIAHGASLDARDREGLTPLAHAAKHGKVKVLVTLKAAGADVTATDSAGRSVRDWAARAPAATRQACLDALDA